MMLFFPGARNLTKLLLHLLYLEHFIALSRSFLSHQVGSCMRHNSTAESDPGTEALSLYSG